MSQGEIFVERRKFKRVDKHLKVTYRLVSLPSELDAIKKQTEKNELTTENISVGGVQLIGEEDLKPEQILRIEFETPSTDNPIITFAEVKWAAQDNNISKYRVGLEFLVLKDDDKKIIEDIIEDNC